MKVLVIVKATKASEAGEMPSQQLLVDMGKFNEQLVKAGVMLDGAGLTPSMKGARVRFSGANRTVIDGPFAETKELISGYWVWKVKNLQEAIDWVKKCPNPMPEDSEIEIRPYFEAEDFGEAFTPELREQEASTRALALGLNAPAFQAAPELVIAGLNQRYTTETRRGIPQQWERFVPRAGGVPGLKGMNFFGVCWNTKPDCSFDYLTGVEVNSDANLPADLSSVRLPGSKYAVFAHTGHVSTLPATLDTIWTKWAPEVSVPLAHAPCFERYTSEFNPTTGMGGMEIWIPLEG
jgi:AraC family transcriptional regulator